MNLSPPYALLRVCLAADEGQTSVNWFAFDAARKFVAHGAAALTQLPAHDELEIVVPAKRVAAHTLSLPAQAGKHLDALIAQSLEDRLLGDKGDALAIPSRQNGDERRVWVSSRRWLEAQLARLSVAGLEADWVFPDYELLPASAEATVHAETPEGTIFRTPGDQFGLVGLVDSATAIGLLTGNASLLAVPDLFKQPRPAHCSNWLSGRLAQHKAVNFDPRVLRRAGVLLGIIGAMLLASQVLHWRQLENREARLQHEIRQTFATAFPGTPIVDPLLQWESKRREQSSQTNGDALDAVLTIATRINAPVHPRRIEARDGLVRMTLTDTEVAQFKAQLEAAGKPESSPAETGLTRLQYRLTQ